MKPSGVTTTVPETARGKGRMTDLVISIGTLDNYPMLESCLRSICQDDDPRLSYEIVVVNNGVSDQRVVSKLAESFPRVRTIYRAPKLGYCAPHNLVMTNSDSRYVLVLDDDTVVKKGTLSKMVAFMDSHPDVGIAVCKVLNPDGTLQRVHGVFPNLGTEILNALKLRRFLPDERRPLDLRAAREVDYILGCFMLVRAEVIRTVGGFDEHYYSVGCEPDWCYRIRRAGWKVMVVPDAEIIHFGGEHSFNATTRSYANIIRHHVNCYYFYEKHYGSFSSFLLRPIMLVGMLLRIPYYAAMYVLRLEARAEAKKRVRAFCRVAILAFSRAPHNMPKDLV